ncbi:MAG: divalent-cation tolerance protein CutA [Gammaproteobacteria bacterium]|nr:MAG: divalent-cation tolerance protein CutA [Gammaproteobacteria bacterium]
MANAPLVVLTTCPDTDTAQTLAKDLVTNGLAACVNILPQMQSVYLWKGEYQSGDEYQLVIKTMSNRYQSLQDYIMANHPYEVAEIVALPITDGSPAYLQWVADSCGETN